MSQGTRAYLLEPKSALVFRTGRPFDQAGDPVSLEFPLPSTIAGACRTAIGDEKGWNFAEKGQELKDIPVHGPLTALITEQGVNPLFPKPADAVYMREEGENKPKLLQLKPEDTNDDTWSDLPNDLTPVCLYQKKELAGKPDKNGAKWWHHKHLTNWLLDNGEPQKIAPKDLGWSGPQQELRTHVQLESTTLSAKKGELFQTSNLSFSQTRIDPDEHSGWRKEHYGLLVKLPENNLQDKSELFQRIGGEGRIARVERQEEGWPLIDPHLEEQLKESKAVRLILATPALFTHGWRPDWLDEKTLTGSPPKFPEKEIKHPIVLKLKAFVVPRWEPVSGWDLVRNPQPEDKQEKKGTGCARAVRRMVPAGAVYWFEVVKGHKHLPELWLQPVSDLPQDRLDGYGLVLPGIWKR